MKKTTLLIFANCFLFFSCSSSKNINRFQKIQYKSITRGYSIQILLQGDILKYFKNNNKTLSLIISKEVKNSLNKLLKKSHPETIGLIKAPSNKFQYDGAMYTTLEVIWNGKNYKSNGFNDDNPPKKLSPFINFLLGLVK
jgi:heat shock protein HslJ